MRTNPTTKIKLQRRPIMEKYVVIGTYSNQDKRAFVVLADNPNKAIRKLLTQVDDNFISVEVIDTYGNLQTIE